MEQWNGEVRIPINHYNYLTEQVAILQREKENLESALKKLSEDNKDRVIRETTTITKSIYGLDTCTKDYKVENFDDVREEVKEIYEKDYKSVLEIEKELNKKKKAENDDLKAEAERLKTENERLKARNLWQRILNK